MMFHAGKDSEECVERCVWDKARQSSHEEARLLQVTDQKTERTETNTHPEENQWQQKSFKNNKDTLEFIILLNYVITECCNHHGMFIDF